MQGLLDAVVDVAGELSLPVTLQRIARAACALAEAEFGALAVIDEDGAISDLVHVGCDADAADRIGRMPQGRGLIGKTLRDRRPLRVRRVSAHPEAVGFPPGHPRFETFLNVPITVRGETFGNLYLGGKRGGEFTGEDEDLVRALATTVGFAIENARLYEDSKRRQAWLVASAEITTALLSAAEPAESVALVARRARQVTSAMVAAIILPGGGDAGRDITHPFSADPFLPAEEADQPDRDADWLEVAVVDGAGADRLRGRRLPAASEFGAAMRAGRAQLVRPDADGRRMLDEVLGGMTFGVAMLVPLLASGHVLGMLVLATSPDAPRLRRLDLEMGAAFAGKASLALRLAQIQRDRERLAVFEDRDRIAQDLHDVVIQRLFATGLQLQALSRQVDGTAADRLGEAVRELDETIEDIRQTIFSLTADKTDLRAEIAAVAVQVERALGIRPTVRVEGNPEDVPEPIRPHLLATVREALSNIARHARATSIEMLLRVTDVEVLVRVRDNGRGPGGASRSSGLTNLRRRAVDLGGRMEFGPAEDGIGTAVTWSVPLALPFCPQQA